MNNCQFVVIQNSSSVKAKCRSSRKNVEFEASIIKNFIALTGLISIKQQKF